MDEQVEFEVVLDEILKHNTRYTKKAYRFLMSALGYTQKRLKKKGHVTGEELVEGIRKLALGIYGPMAKRVLESWGVRTTDDWGEIVFILVKAKILGKTSEDKKEDFKDIYDFEDVFVKKYKYEVRDK